MKNYYIIGGTSGIGLELTKSLSKDNKVTVISRYNKNQIKSGNVIYEQNDVTSLDFAINNIPLELDGLVYCPGTVNLKSIRQLKIEDFQNDLEINVLGAIKVIQQLLPALRRKENSSIVLFSTVAVNKGMPFHSSIATAKGAIEGLAKSLAAELAPKIRVNVVAPSLIQTPLTERLTETPEKVERSAQRHPLKRIGNTSDVSNMVEYLLSDKANWMTGQVIQVDGGITKIAG